MTPSYRRVGQEPWRALAFEECMSIQHHQALAGVAPLMHQSYQGCMMLLCVDTRTGQLHNSMAIQSVHSQKQTLLCCTVLDKAAAVHEGHYSVHIYSQPPPPPTHTHTHPTHPTPPALPDRCSPGLRSFNTIVGKCSFTINCWKYSFTIDILHAVGVRS
jgi:hypothetical protein